MIVDYQPELVQEELLSLGNQQQLIHLNSMCWAWKECMPIYVFDMDGTICDSTHRHHYLQSTDAEGNIVPRPGGKDWDSFFKAQKDDALYRPISEIMEALISAQKVVLILTARPESQREESERWLREHMIPYHGLFMRPTSNRTDDNELKVHQLHTYLKTRVSLVRTVFEDRRRIVHSMRHHGFHVCHVAEGDF